MILSRPCDEVPQWAGTSTVELVLSVNIVGSASEPAHDFPLGAATHTGTVQHGTRAPSTDRPSEIHMLAPRPEPGSPFDIALIAGANLQLKHVKPLSGKSPRQKAGRVVRRVVRKNHYIPKKKVQVEITREHEFYNLTYCMMIGIRYFVGKQSPLTSSELTRKDFTHVRKVYFPPQGSTCTPPHQLRNEFKFKDYAPKVFRRLRRKFGINESDYMLSLCGDFNFIEFISNSKSGQFFFYSHDSKYVIKTMSKQESKFLRRVLPRYFIYMLETPCSLITRFYGMHRVKLPHMRRRMHFVIMASVFAGDKELQCQYDLKGSMVGRFASPSEKVYKDQDFLRHRQSIALGHTNKAKFVNQIRRDSTFLQKLRIMDYSLLLGIRNVGDDRVDDGAPAYQSGCQPPSNVCPPRPGDPGRGAICCSLLGSDLGRLRPYSSRGPFFRDCFVWGKKHCCRSSSSTVFGGAQGGSGGRAVCSTFSGGDFGNAVYYMGIIDILQQYNFRKIGEHAYKTLVRPSSAHHISAVTPSEYALRFVQFLEGVTK